MALRFDILGCALMLEEPVGCLVLQTQHGSDRYIVAHGAWKRFALEA